LSLQAAGLANLPWAPGAAALAHAAEVVEAVAIRGQSADAALATHARSPQRAAVRAIALGTIRWYLRLAPAVEMLLVRPADVSPMIGSLLAAAAHQIEYSRNAPEATVDAAVDAARILKSPRASGLVNAVLRRFLAERAALLARVDAGLAARTAHPAWLAERICAAWPQQGQAVLAADNEHPPMTLRVDLSRSSVEEYVARLADAEIDSHTIQWMDSAVALTHPVGVSALPGFAEGLVSVQDAGAQLAVPLLDARPGMRVLDACAAPGGKTGQLLERLGAGTHVTALDVDRERVALIDENLRRLGRTAQLAVGDARQPETFWDGQPFERILVDAPCSSTGVIRRHPDIKLLRRPSDIRSFAALQLAILRALVPLLSPGGRLLYSTCSVLPEENEEVALALLAAEACLAAVPGTFMPPGALPRPVGWQLLPGSQAGTDGFYYACLEKTTTGT
jgi:16S rRNA (cytosine967-C5)-methyltransferase